MKRRFKKVLACFPLFVSEYYEMLFSSAAENQIKIANSGRKTFRSYIQLKKHQKKVRMYLVIVFLLLISMLLGILVGPVFFPRPAASEVYIPNGKGDILLGNISKNQVTVIFKTLDSANGNKPLATKATIEVYEDSQYLKLERRTKEDDYAVTHIILVDSLQEGKLYYIRVIAKDAAATVHTKIVSSWGGGNDPITVYTIGELVSNCAASSSAQNVAPLQNADSAIDTPAVRINEGAKIADNTPVANPIENSSLNISEVQNENHLQPGNKVQTIISWITNMPASSVIIYREENTGEKRQLSISDQLLMKHAAILTTLKAGTIYYFKVQSKDVNENTITSEEYALHTPFPQENVIQKISDNFNQLLHQIKHN